jgi:hypothetical protein
MSLDDTITKNTNFLTSVVLPTTITAGLYTTSYLLMRNQTDQIPAMTEYLARACFIAGFIGLGSSVYRGFKYLE